MFLSQKRSKGRILPLEWHLFLSSVRHSPDPMIQPFILFDALVHPEIQSAHHEAIEATGAGSRNDIEDTIFALAQQVSKYDE